MDDGMKQQTSILIQNATIGLVITALVFQEDGSSVFVTFSRMYEIDRRENVNNIVEKNKYK